MWKFILTSNEITIKLQGKEKQELAVKKRTIVSWINDTLPTTQGICIQYTQANIILVKLHEKQIPQRIKTRNNQK